jgi:hypothetical protein
MRVGRRPPVPLDDASAATCRRHWGRG